jgi:hypothetical protein
VGAAGAGRAAGAGGRELGAAAAPRRGSLMAAGAFSLAAARQTAAAARAEDPERRLVRLIAEVGVHRAIAMLPAPLARAVVAIREVARMLTGLARGR